MIRMPEWHIVRHFAVVGMWEHNLGRDKLDVQYIGLLEKPKNLPAFISLSAAHDISCREEEAHASSLGGIKDKLQFLSKLVS